MVSFLKKKNDEILHKLPWQANKKLPFHFHDLNDEKYVGTSVKVCTEFYIEEKTNLQEEGTFVNCWSF